MDQYFQLQQSSHPTKRWPVVLVSIILTALIVGGSTYWYIDTKAKESKKELQAQIDDLNSRLSQSSVTGTSSSGQASAIVLPAGWKTYSDNTGYTIKYPGDYQISTVKTTTVGFGTASDTAPFLVSINSTRVATNFNLDTYINNQVSGQLAKDCTKTTLDNKSAYECLSLGITNEYEIMVANNDYLYTIFFNTDDKETLAESKNTLTTTQKNMLGSFSFTTNSWQTYTNSDYKFSFKYPTTMIVKSNTIQAVGTFGGPKDKLELSDDDNNSLHLWINSNGFGLHGSSDYYSATINDSGRIIVDNKDQRSVDGETGQALIGSATFKNNSYAIAYNFDLANRAEALITFEQILSTFIFE